MTSIVLLLTILFVSLWITTYKTDETIESFALLYSVGPIVFDSSLYSIDKVEAMKALNPPITDETIIAFLNSGNDPDGIISDIKTYLGSCPADNSTIDISTPTSMTATPTPIMRSFTTYG
jgi:hypothetical protein